MSKRKLGLAEMHSQGLDPILEDAKHKAAKKQKGEETDGPFHNKQRVLVFSSRGITSRYRHLMNDVRKLLPHCKKEVKMEKKDTLQTINEIADIKNCNNCIFFEVKKNEDCYLWFSKTPNGPSAKFHVTNGVFL
jgi:ribosome biogenesis protein BRX1